MMKTVILCGGFGTRIRDVADDIPKPMIPIGGLPILWHIMKYYSMYKNDNFVLCLGYKSNSIKNFFLNYTTSTRDFTLHLGRESSIDYHTDFEESDWTVTLAETGQKTMTGGRVNRIRKYVENEDCFMLTYGDGVGNINIDELIKFHKSHGKTITLTGVRPPGRFGELELDEYQVTGFNEKPQVAGGLINGGFFICNKNIFDYMAGDDSLVFEQEPMKKLVEAGELMVYKHNGFWQPMDTYRDYTLLNDLFNKGAAPWKIW
jgi:glucose-1-phosphate cytidylyltransferase